PPPPPPVGQAPPMAPPLPVVAPIPPTTYAPLPQPVAQTFQAAYQAAPFNPHATFPHHPPYPSSAQYVGAETDRVRQHMMYTDTARAALSVNYQHVPPPPPPVPDSGYGAGVPAQYGTATATATGYGQDRYQNFGQQPH